MCCISRACPEPELPPLNLLRAHAQDAATAQGLSLSPHVNDLAMIELMVSSIFDSGYFESIRVVDPASGELLVERIGAPVSGEAPQWFARLVDLAPARGDAIVSDGWRQAAQVQVISHPLFAVGKLWQSALGNLLWLALSLSGHTVREPQALARLFELLQQYRHLGPRLSLELDEDQLPEQAELEALTQRLRGLGFSLGLQHFGGRFA